MPPNEFDERIVCGSIKSKYMGLISMIGRDARTTTNLWTSLRSSLSAAADTTHAMLAIAHWSPIPSSAGLRLTSITRQSYAANVDMNKLSRTILPAARIAQNARRLSIQDAKNTGIYILPEPILRNSLDELSDNFRSKSHDETGAILKNMTPVSSCDFELKSAKRS